MRVTPAHRVLKSKRPRPRKLLISLHDCGTFVCDVPQSTSVPAPVLQTPATESESNHMDTSSEGSDENRVDAEKMSSSDALSSGTPEHANKAVSSEEPPCPTSVQASSTQRQLAMLLELFHAQADEMNELEEELVQLRAQAGSSHPPPPPATVHWELAPPMVQVTPKDVILEAFHGSKDPESLSLTKNSFYLF
jgi:hypothetical protein